MFIIIIINKNILLNVIFYLNIFLLCLKDFYYIKTSYIINFQLYHNVNDKTLTPV